ncbi:MAG: hypothetical protein HYT98_05255 [Candidatus Sungbacteria bacterium]|nr:hypothetical protein [Candidatus Sungbacteria bacterium]
MKLHIFATHYKMPLPPNGKLVRVRCGEEIPMNDPVDIPEDIDGARPDGTCPKCLNIEIAGERLPRFRNLLIAEFEKSDLAGIEIYWSQLGV